MTNVQEARKQTQSRRASWGGFEKKSVSFSEYSEMTLFEYPTAQDNHAKWYTKANMKRFRRVMLRDADRQSRGYLKAREEDPDAPLPEGELTKYVGLLHLLSDNVIERQQEIEFARKVHAYTVLSEQINQRKRQASCEKKLARISELSSLEARERALHVAELYMKVDECARLVCERGAETSMQI